MQKTLQEWVVELGPVDLPVLPATRVKLAALERRMDVSGAQITTAVLPDPMMVLKVMRMVNSGRGARFAQPVLIIEHAVMMAGMSSSFSRMLATPVLDAVVKPQYLPGWMQTVARARHAAGQGRDWGWLRLDMNVEEVYIACLLQEIGELALWRAAPDKMQKLVVLRRKIGAEQAELEVFGFSLDELSLALARAWTLPPLIVSALDAEFCEAHPRARAVSLARRLARHAERGWYDEAVLHDADELADILRITPDEAAARMHRTAVTVAQSVPTPGVTPAAAWLPMLPGEWPEEDLPKTDGVSFDAVMAEIGRHFDGSLHLNELMKLVLRGMRDGVGLKRVVFALLNDDGSQLRARFVVGAAEGTALRQFQFDMQQTSLFSKMMGRQQAFWLNDATRAKAEALLTDEVRHIAAREFFVMTIMVDAKVIGMFYVDRENQALDADAYEKFKQLCTQAAVGMAHLAKS